MIYFKVRPFHTGKVYHIFFSKGNFSVRSTLCSLFAVILYQHGSIEKAAQGVNCNAVPIPFRAEFLTLMTKLLFSVIILKEYIPAAV